MAGEASNASCDHVTLTPTLVRNMGHTTRATRLGRAVAVAALLATCAAQQQVFPTGTCPNNTGVFSAIELTSQGPRQDWTLAVTLSPEWNIAGCNSLWHRVICSWPQRWCDGRSTTFATVDVADFSAGIDNATGALTGRTLYRPSWRDWELCVQNRPLWATCRMVLRSQLMFPGNDTDNIPPQLVGDSAPFLAQPEYPPGARKHAYGRLRWCAHRAADFHPTSGAPTALSCLHNSAPVYGSRNNGSNTVVVSTLLYDTDSTVTGSTVAVTAAPGAIATYGDVLAQAPANTWARYVWLRNLWVGRYLLLTELDGVGGAVLNRIFTPLGWCVGAACSASSLRMMRRVVPRTGRFLPLHGALLCCTFPPAGRSRTRRGRSTPPLPGCRARTCGPT